MRIKSSRPRAFTLLLLMLLLPGIWGELRAEFRCTLADYRGSYGFYATGAILQLPPQAGILVGPFAQSGIFTSDGRGNIQIESTASFNGLPFPTAEPATYTVTPDCVFVVTTVIGDPLNVTAKFAGVFSTSMRQNTLTIIEPAGALVIGEHFKQDFQFCGLPDFSGEYQIDIGGSIASPAARAGLFHRSGLLVADGNGRFTASTLANYAGRQTTENFRGTYTVNVKCIVTLSYAFGGENVTVRGPIVGRGEAVMMHVFTQGWSVSGMLRSLRIPPPS